ncbi:MAG: hypothetical protein QNJ13_13565 [Paracoccaceae bacterium]|nr:hypothetical protein [Paracoccaceae bacterium]
MRLALAALVLLTACAQRPLTEAERGFIETIHGPTVDYAAIRVARGSISAAFDADIPERPRDTCRERIFPPRTGQQTIIFPGLTLDSTMYFTEAFWAEDYTAGYPDRLPLRDAMRLAHEVTHVWQWQQRAATRYHPLKALAEHIEEDDPYLVAFDPARPFLSYAWEQQGTLVEEFVCCRALDPESPKTAALHAMLSEPFPGLARRDAVPLAGVELPWDGAETQGICSA